MVGRQRLARRSLSVSRHIVLLSRLALLVFLHLERLDAVRELDDFDAAAETRLGHVGLDLRQEVVVGGRLAAEPWVLECFLFFVNSILTGVGGECNLLH